eukprot:CAMPEP_0117773712 /NCGR_PEP_ID=MMETSP0947-20121206/26031_1 /TAXON_ID=44440 /ORGANISM="Chattonella subsalsa, Strain CCMP2191" /LENGTH=165 /DNA_ID=CAMNT_0005599931 /DNA_START=39 /DNA_END=536 /DNA_ORIENTATION=+
MEKSNGGYLMKNDDIDDDTGPSVSTKIDVRKEKFPHSIVWCPLPPITWICPIIGHLGITDEEGRIYDFAGPYTIGTDHLIFGRVARYIQLDPAHAKSLRWDEAVTRANGDYSQRMHNICCDNCHSHVATALAYMKYRGGALSSGICLFWPFGFSCLASTLLLQVL